MQKLVIVAFGDSLTVGYLSLTVGDDWPQPVPYTRFLRRRVDALLRSAGDAALNVDVEFLNRGIVGELTEDMLNRFNRDVIEIRPDTVIVLGGSNDLGWGLGPQSVASNLTAMYDDALRNEIQPISCTVPSVLGWDEGIEPRLRLNELIKERSADRGIACVDIFLATSDPSGRLKTNYSNDGLHLSEAGYEVMADAIFSEAISAVVSKRLGR